MSTVRGRRIHKPGVPAKVEQPVSIPAKDVFLERFARTLNAREARIAAGLSNKDLDQARVDDAEFDAKVVEIEEQVLDKIEERAVEMTRDDPAMVRWMLERRRPDKYGNKSRLDLNVRDVSKLSDEDLEMYILQCQGKSKR